MRSGERKELKVTGYTCSCSLRQGVQKWRGLVGGRHLVSKGLGSPVGDNARAICREGAGLDMGHYVGVVPWM